MDAVETVPASDPPAMAAPARDRLRIAAAALSLVAAFIHMIAVDEHLREWWGYGLFFLFASVAQAFYGILLLTQPWKPSQYGDPTQDRRRLERPFYFAGVAGNLSLILLYLVTRTVGIPFFGPGAGRVEEYSGLGIVSKLVEAALVACLIVRTRRTPTAA